MDDVQAVDPNFGATHFGNAPLGDVRRVRLLVKLADRMAARPGQSLPKQVQDTATYQALLGLVQRPEVTHQTVLHQHIDLTCRLIRQHPGTVLIPHDTTELDYTSHKSLEKIGQIGDGNGRGYECHNSLAVVADSGETLGLANQILHRRDDVPKNESVAAKRERETRESLLWPKGCAAVGERCALHGSGSPGHLEVHIFDRGGDTFENCEAQALAGRTYVCRSNHNRAITIGHEDQDQKALLHDHVGTLPEVGRLTVPLRAQPARPAQDGRDARPACKARTATLALSLAAVQILAPHVKRGKHGDEPLKVWVVRIWEVDAPVGAEPLEWILLTNQPVKTFEDAVRVKRWYEARWIIEDLHKSQKTGCAIEKLQFTKEERLEPVIALLSVIAVWLLRLRYLSRQEDLQSTPAVAVVPAVYVAVLSVTQGQGRRLDMSAAEFFLRLAQLGGYGYARKGRQPGWLVLWRGWGELQSRVQYALASGMEKMDSTEVDPEGYFELDAAPSG
jgi:hypothetical protein